jgi:hypothetical protein
MALPTKAQIDSAVATGIAANVLDLFTADTNSTDMTNCKRCDTCEGCTDCADCKRLTNGLRCYKCEGTASKPCVNLTDCINVDKCADCTSCSEITDSQNCDNCHGDATVTAAGVKYNKLGWCKNLIQCRQCLWVENATNVECMVGNVQYTSAGFNAIFSLVTGR